MAAGQRLSKKHSMLSVGPNRAKSLRTRENALGNSSNPLHCKRLPAIPARRGLEMVA
jgi:hypothetical protein